ncbi:MAG: hypothetical protein J2P34_03480 [Actinobacteria bacterium]|nr:hypothetical protein [Actinomycetota bacterium]
MPRRSALPAGAPFLAVAALALAAGCGSAGNGPGAPASATAGAHLTGRNCGSGRTAAGVRVLIVVQRGQVACATAQAVEQSYARAIASGKVPGNGGGAPVRVRGWVCQGFNTPDVLRTGDASRCTKGSARILAVLPAPAGSS